MLINYLSLPSLFWKSVEHLEEVENMADSSQVEAEGGYPPSASYIPPVVMTYEQVVELWLLFKRWDINVAQRQLHGFDVIENPNPASLPDWIQMPVDTSDNP